MVVNRRLKSTSAKVPGARTAAGAYEKSIRPKIHHVHSTAPREGDATGLDPLLKGYSEATAVPDTSKLT